MRISLTVTRYMRVENIQTILRDAGQCTRIEAHRSRLNSFLMEWPPVGKEVARDDTDIPSLGKDTLSLRLLVFDVSSAFLSRSGPKFCYLEFLVSCLKTKWDESRGTRFNYAKRKPPDSQIFRLATRILDEGYPSVRPGSDDLEEGEPDSCGECAGKREPPRDCDM